MSKLYRYLTIVFALWLLAWLWVSWPAVQDDAFIHLRYAVNLLQHHMISYDGVHPDYGTSSLLYVWLLACCRAFCKSPLLPRAVSSIFHFLLFAGLAWEFPRALRRAPRLAWTFALVLLGILVTPMAVRWLDDGMETSLTLCLVSLLAFAVSRLGQSDAIRARSAWWLGLLGFVATLTRVEYLLLMGVASLTLFLARSSLRDDQTSQKGMGTRLRLAAACTAPLLGSLLAAGLIFRTMHALVPDTAVAKASGGAPWQPTLQATASVFVSSASIGIGLLLFWLLTAATVIVYRRRISLAILAANSLFPVVWVLAGLRGQQIQGVRYFLWTLLFPILWNILELRWIAAVPSPTTLRRLTVATYGMVSLLLISMPLESVLLYKEFHARERSLTELRAQHLERLHSLTLVAFDVGYIGYFTESPVCDMAGLVNGRARAALPFEQRVRDCAAEHPKYAFVSGFSLAELKNAMDLKGWSVCSVYNFANLRSSDLHYLIASPAATREVCSAAGNTPQPLAFLLDEGSR
ncbi:MAG: hypothetical protein WB439_00975 [Acidobacteriaceae bacterium]